jgi:hypothetical protein
MKEKADLFLRLWHISWRGFDRSSKDISPIVFIENFTSLAGAPASHIVSHSAIANT